MKYSIIVVAYEAVEQLHKCLESLTKFPPANSQHEAEIIVVDNSPAPVDIPNPMLHAALMVYVRFIIVRDGVNRGFAEGCNEGVRHSHGKNLVFVNPDTEVNEGWAERMAKYLEIPKIGAVGPLSNFVAGFQRMDLHLQPLPTFQETAAMAARVLAGRGVETKLLIGFFLMIPRKVWDEVGGMDPIFFLGCDDLDLSLRLRDAGYSLIIATDVLIYHEGHASFYAAGAAAMAHNKRSEKAMLAKLRARYGDGNVPSSTELWGCEILPTFEQPRMTLSILMMVRNELDNLRELLPQLNFADEIVIVNNSSEGTPAVPDFEYESPGGNPRIKIYDFGDHEPLTDYAAARNFGLSKCSMDWVLWVDADDRLPVLSRQLLRAALDSPGPLTALRKCHYALRLRDHLPNGKLGFTDQPRLFPNIPGIFWEGRIHENYMVQADRLGLTLVTSGIVIDHHGYEDAERLAAKHARNLAILETDIDSPLKFFQIGKSSMGLRRFEAARGAFRAVLEHPWEKPLMEDFAAQVRYLMALSYYQELGRAAEPMDALLEGNPKPDALFLRAERAFFEKEWNAAETMFQEYAGYGEIMDYYGTDRDTFQPCAVLRLQQIEQLRSLVPG